MIKRMVYIFICGIFILGLFTGCNNNLTKENQGSSSNNTDTNSEIPKTVVCKKEDTFYPKMESVYLKGDKLIKVINNHTAKDQGTQYNRYCEDVKGRYDGFKNIKGLEITVTCNDNDTSVYDEEIYIVDEITNFDELVGDVLPSQLGGAYFNEDTHEFNLEFWLEGKTTQGYTCEES